MAPKSAVLGLTIGLYLLSMFFEADGKARMARRVADEIQIVRLCRVHRGT